MARMWQGPMATALPVKNAEFRILGGEALEYC